MYPVRIWYPLLGQAPRSVGSVDRGQREHVAAGLRTVLHHIYSYLGILNDR